VLRVFVPSVIIVGVHGKPVALIPLLPPLLALRFCAHSLATLHFSAGIKELTAIRASLLAAAPPLFGYHAPLSAMIRNGVLKNRGLLMAGNELHNDTHYTENLNQLQTNAGRHTSNRRFWYTS